MANKKSFNFIVASLATVFGKMELRKMNDPFEFENPNTKIKKTTTKVKVLCDSDDEKGLDDDTAEFLEITLEGEFSKDLFKKGQIVDFVNSTISVRSDGKIAFGRADSWLDITIRAEKMVVYDPETGEVTEVGIESIKPSGESKPQETPEQQQAPTQESNKSKGNKGN